jgi:hypothetical protein
MAYLILENSGRRAVLPEGGYFDFDPDSNSALENIQAVLSARYGNGEHGAPVTLLSASSDEQKHGSRGMVKGFFSMMKPRRKYPVNRTPRSPRSSGKKTTKPPRFLGHPSDLSMA